MKRYTLPLLILTMGCVADPTAVLELPVYEASTGKGGTASIVVSPSTVALLVGQSVTLTSSKPSVRWSSSNDYVATVSSSGRVTANHAGTATITAKLKSLSGTATVTVSAPPSEDPPIDPGTPPPTSGAGIWVSASELAALPTSGAAWDNLLSTANSDCGTPDLSNQDQMNNVCVMAQALVYARTGTALYRDRVVTAIRSVATSGTYSGRALALGRELGAYAIAADLIGLAQVDATLDAQFRSKLRELLTTPTTDGPTNLVHCHELRPNNWGTHCGGSRVAVAAYLGDTTELARAAQVFKGYLGDRSAYAGFSYGELSWQCDASRPVGINPAGCTKDGHSIDGVLPDDQRRGGSFGWPPPAENYVYEALQGALAQAVVLSRRGYDVWNWENQALLRAFRWLHDVAAFPAVGDDSWQPHVINRVYGTSFPAPLPARAGKNVGWTDWTHR